MPTYPTTIPLGNDSQRVPRDGRQESVADNGDTYVRKLYSADKYDFELRHPGLSSSELSTLQAFYDANVTGTFDLVWPADGVTYTGLRFGRGGLRTQYFSPGRMSAFVRLVA